MARHYTVAIVGATGAVGQVTLDMLTRRRFPIERLLLFASERSRGRSVCVGGEELPLRMLTPGCFRGVDLVFFSAGGSVSKAFVPQAVNEGALVIDKSSLYRNDPAVPLIVPEVNRAALATHRGIIANPNCSTIQLVAALAPLHKAAELKRVIVSTYQAASGAGAAAREELTLATRAALEDAPFTPKRFAHNLAFNLIPAIDVFQEDGTSKEEQKMVLETRKILGLPELPLAATCVRVPVPVAHSESVWCEFARPLSVADARAAWKAAEGVVVLDDPAANTYPTPALAAGQDPVYVGRTRLTPGFPNALSFFCVADNLRKGAALNGVQIAECLVADGLLAR